LVWLKGGLDMRKLLLLVLCICFISIASCTKSIKQRGSSLASSNINTESRLSSDVKSSEVISGSNSTISNVNPSVLALLNSCGYVRPIDILKINSFIPNYNGIADLYELSPLKEIGNKKSYATISTQEGGTFYLFFVYDDDVKMNCQTHYFYMNGSVAVSELQSVKTGDNLHDCLRRIDKANSSIYEKRAFINNYNDAVLVWTNDGLYALKYEYKNEVPVVKEVKKCLNNTYSYDGYAFELLF